MGGKKLQRKVHIYEIGGKKIVLGERAKEFGCVAKGGRKFLDASRRGGEKFWISNFLESLGKIKGHV